MSLHPVATRTNPVVLTFNLKTTRLNVIATIFHVAATTFHLMTTGFDVAATTFHLMTTGFDVTATTFHRTATGLANFSRILFLIIPDLIIIRKIILFVEMKIAYWGGINGFSCKLSFQNLMMVVFMMRLQKPHKHSSLAAMDRLRTIYIGVISGNRCTHQILLCLFGRGSVVGAEGGSLPPIGLRGWRQKRSAATPRNTPTAAAAFFPLAADGGAPKREIPNFLV